MLLMARDGLSALACALPVLSLLLAPAPLTAQERDPQIATTLAVQTALQQGREYLLHGKPQAAVTVLEGQLSRINGSREYLGTLRDAYRAYIRELRLANKEAEAAEYLKRLRILDPGALMDGSVARGANPQPGGDAPPAPLAVAPEPARPAPTARAKVDDDPFRPENAARPESPGALRQAEQEFLAKHFDSAARLYEQAYHANPNLANDTREQWAYCKLHQVVRQLNHPPAGGPTYGDLEREVRVALDLAPRLEDYGKGLLKRIQERQAAADGAGRDEAPVAVRHTPRQADGWAVAETANFRVFHNQPREVAERVAQVAERTRAAMQRKWFGDAGEDWNPRCDLYLHATAQDYSQATGVPANTPGHSTIRAEAGRVVGRRMDLHCDFPNLVATVLPHETTHVVIAGRFGECPVPRWADEGMAVLTEPREQIDRHLRKLPEHRQNRELFNLRQLMQMNDYPDPHYIGSFYAESVSLVDFLARQKGPQTFTTFLREGLRGGYEPALRRYYGFTDFNDLEQHWVQAAFTHAGAGGEQRGR
jgi:hypothetical protein